MSLAGEFCPPKRIFESHGGGRLAEDAVGISASNGRVARAPPATTTMKRTAHNRRRGSASDRARLAPGFPRPIGIAVRFDELAAPAVIDTIAAATVEAIELAASTPPIEPVQLGPSAPPLEPVDLMPTDEDADLEHPLGAPEVPGVGSGTTNSDAPVLDGGPHLGKRATKAFAWILSRNLFTRGLSFISFAILARLLTSTAYGIAALANVFLVLLLLVTSAGLAQALVQRETIDEVDLDSAFWMSTTTGAVLTLILGFAAWPLSSALGQPGLRPVLQAMSVCLLFAGVASTSQAILQRRLAFGVLAKNGMTSSAIATAVGITFAFLGFGVWSLVIQTIIASGGASLGLIIAARFRPGRRATWARSRSLLSFSAHVLGVQLTNFFNNRTDDFLVGTVRGPHDLGIYTVAYSLLAVMNDVLLFPVQMVIFPVFSRLQNEVVRLRQAYLTAMRTAIFASAPVFLFVAAAAPDLVPGLFGQKWHASVPVMQILCLYGPLNCIMQFNAALLTSIGRPRTVFRISVAGTVLQVAFFAIGVNFGIAAVAASYVVRAYLIAPVGLIIASRALGNSVRPMLFCVIPVAISCAAMVLAVEGVRSALGHSLPQLVAVLAFAVVALPVYLLTMRVIAAEHLRQALHYARQLAPGRFSATGA